MTNKTFRAYWYEAIASTPAEQHVHATRVMKGECYLIAKTDDPNFVSITGKLYTATGGFDRVYDKHLHKNRVKGFVKLIDVSDCLNTCPNG